MFFKNIHFFTLAAVLTGSSLATSSSKADVSSFYKRDQGNSNHSPVIIPKDSPNQFWFGQDHKDTPVTVLQSDALIDQLLSWNVPWSLIQVAQEKPGQPRNVQEVLRPTVKQYDNNFDSLSSPQKYFLSCFNDDNRAIQAKLNANCKKEPCAVSYFMYDVWGTRGHMNYAIDGVMARACGIVSVKGEGKDCDFPNGPACQIKFVQDFTLLQDSGVTGIQQMGQFHNTQEIVQVMESFANATHQKFTLPDGSMTH